MKNYAHTNSEKETGPHAIEPSVDFDYGSLVDVDETIREFARYGKLEELRDRLQLGEGFGAEERLRLVRDIACELGGARDRHLAVDVLVYAADLDQVFDLSMREYAAKNGYSVETFSEGVAEMQRRLGLPRRTDQKSDQAREVYSLNNGRSHAA